MSRLSPSPLRQLADIISASVDKIDTSFSKNNLLYPNLDAPYDPSSSSEAASMAPDIIQAGMLIVAACAQLGATVKIPALTLYDVVGGFHVSSALRVAVESNIVEILRENPQGLHVKDIAAQNGMEASKIARVLRLLATHHVFLEIAPDTFAHNRLSSMLDSTKSVEDIKAKPEDKHVGSPGLGALIEHCGDEVFKGSAFMAETLLDPVRGHSDNTIDSPMNVAFKSSKPSWEWYEEPGNELRFKRFAAAMEGSSKAEPPDTILQGFKWADLPEKSTVVDVGGGIGHTTLKIYEKHPKLNYIVQDRPAVIKQAKHHWNKTSPAALGGSVELQDHDFFTPQPVTNASVFVCRMIMHDYGRTKAIEILSHLRKAATKETKLLLVDQIVPYACPGTVTTSDQNIIGAEQIVPPEPLLYNLGKANAIAYLGDFQMYVGLNGEERTLGSFIDVTESSQWKIIQVYTIPGSSHKQILAVPV